MAYSDIDTSLQDLEKHDSSSSEDESDIDYSTTSSRYSVHSDTRILSAGRYRAHKPIFEELSSPRRQRKTSSRFRLPRIQSALCHCTPRKFSRCFTLFLLAICLIVIFTLTKLSWDSARNVSLGLHRAKQKPPAWEKFAFLKRYHGGIRTLISKELNVPEYPLSKSGRQVETDYSQKLPELPPSVPFEWLDNQEGVVECFLDSDKKTKIPDVRVYNGVPRGFPDSVMGSHSLIGLKDDVCFERFGRLGPYGFGYEKARGGSGAGMEGHRDGVDAVWSQSGLVDFRRVNWHSAQDKCFKANQRRFSSVDSKAPKNTLFQDNTKRQAETKAESTPVKQIPRKAIVVRTWTGYEYDDEDLFYLRALAWELSLKTGAEYTLHFLIHVKDENLPIWADEEVYAKTLKEALPAEFQGMGTLWSEQQMLTIYNKLPQNHFRDLPLHGAYRSLHMPLAWFAHQHPEFEHIWHFEMDMRYTGQYRHFVNKVEKWAAQQPRKGLWERNARFYVPSEHGSWDDFTHMVRVQTEHGTASKSNMFAGLVDNPSVPQYVKNEMTTKAEKAIWGPEPPLLDVLDNSTDVFPPTTMAEDKGEWGVGEEADLIVFNPLFDPQGTNWLLSEDVTGYNKTHGLPPRRTAVTTFGRYSNRLLTRMHKDMALGGKHMFPEMFPATTALHHGYKAVYIPHPVYIDRAWPTDFLAATFNGGRNGQSGGSRMSVFSNENEHNFKGVTWYYDAGFAPNLWHRWLGYKIDNDGGEQHEVSGEGRMCLPAMLVHPVKQVDLIYQEMGEDEDGA